MHLAKRTIILLIQSTKPECTDMASPMVTFRNGVVLDWFGTYPTDCDFF
jgi:hypothetical protein